MDFVKQVRKPTVLQYTLYVKQKSEFTPDCFALK